MLRRCQPSATGAGLHVPTPRLEGRRVGLEVRGARRSLRPSLDPAMRSLQPVTPPFRGGESRLACLVGAWEGSCDGSNGTSRSFLISKFAIVTGSDSGIGEAIAVARAETGYEVG